MNCIVADWEIRNLGVRTIEVEIGKDESCEGVVAEVNKFRLEHGAKYVVVKVDTRNPAASCVLQADGFCLIETQICVKTNRAINKDVIKKYSPFYSDVTYRATRANKDIDFVVAEMQKGIFDTDRIALDKHFGIDYSKRRYINWFLDSMERGATLYMVEYNGEDIGFFQKKDIDDRHQYETFLSLFSNKKNNCDGAMIYYASAKEFYDEKNKVCKGAVSANNLTALQLDLTFGSRPYCLKSVLVKHF